MDHTIDWQRCFHIDRTIDEDLLNELIPKVLALRQEGDSPITIGLNSPGGAVALLPTIRGVARGLDQRGRTCELVTVATHKAYSAAAMLLAMGDYAVALPNSEILFHDVRYSTVRDVTPESALRAAQSLEIGNDLASLDIAEHMFRRWMWMYLDVHLKVADLREEAPAQVKSFERAVGQLNLPKSDHLRIDLVALMLFMHKQLSIDNEGILENALTKLARWGAVSSFANRPMYRVRGARRPGTLDGLAQLFREFHPKEAMLGGKENEENINLFFAVLALALQGRTAKDALELALREMNLFSSINNPRHWHTAVRQMLRHKAVFFTYEVAAAWDSLGDAERDKIVVEASPVVRVIWLLCLQVARELFSGEHRLRPIEALVLGLVDEVPGTDLFECKRAFGLQMAAQREAPAAS